MTKPFLTRKNLQKSRFACTYDSADSIANFAKVVDDVFNLFLKSKL